MTISRNTTDLDKQIEYNKLHDWPDLTDQQKLFGLHYVESYVVSKAAKQSNTPPNAAYGWLRSPLMVEFINELQSVLDNRSVITKDFVNLQWLNLLPKLLGEEKTCHIDKDGDEFEAKKFHAGESVRLLTELSKATGFYGEDNPGDKGSLAPTQINFVIKSATEVDSEDAGDGTETS